MESNPVKESVVILIKMVEAQQFLEAIEKFYAEGATMQENSGPLRVGLQALLDGERYALAHRLKDIHVSKATSFVVSGNRAAINWVFEYTDYDGNSCRLDEVAYQLWQDGKIVEERFFYNPGEVRLQS